MTEDYDLDKLIEGQKIYLPNTLLKQKDNRVEISYIGNYHNDGSGLVKSIDYDGFCYIYTNCEPFHAQAIYPCFNTMGLRGDFKLKVACPKAWCTVSNEKVQTSMHFSDVTDKQLFKEFGVSRSC